MPLTMQEATELIESQMRVVVNPPQRTGLFSMGYTSYGYDVYLPSLAANEFGDGRTGPHTEAVGMLLDAAWWFVGRGLLRPGVRATGGQSTDEGAYAGFSLTQLGRDWLAREAPPELPVTSPSRMNALLSTHTERFGAGYARRATEAVNCYDVRQYLACCVMAGAAAEGILLTAVIAKIDDEARALQEYSGRNGRSWAERTLTGQAPGHITSDYRSYMDLLKYWRDNAAHGAVTNIAEEEAYLALVNLARFARFVDTNWTTLTGKT